MNTLVVAKRELAAFFVSPVAYVVGAAFLFITGLFFVFTVVLGGVATLGQVFQVISIVLLFVAPILTMRLLSEEARSGTLELLLTAPVRDGEVVVGKFLAAFLFFLAMLTPTLYYLFLLTRYGNPDLPVTFSGYLGVILLGAVLLGFGMLTSAMSANQIVAAVLGVALGLTFWLAGGLGNTFPGFLGSLLEYLSLQQHFFDFLLGLITSTNIVYFLSVTAASLFLATRVLEMRRWR
ncbi:MAG: ABC transporter permease subunit [Anaerolineae bacterium]|nr:ABC transporter permease subunit [Anaerolineae bacterium]